MLGASWAVLGRRRAEKKNMPKSFKNLKKSNDFCPFGHSWRTSWRALGPSWRPLAGPGGSLRPSRGHLGPSWVHLGATLVDFETILAVLEASWRQSWATLAVLEAIMGHMGHLGAVWGRKTVCNHLLRVAGGTCRSPRGSSFGKRTKTKTVIIQHARHPCDESTGGGGSTGLRPIPPPCLGGGSEAS